RGARAGASLRRRLDGGAHGRRLRDGARSARARGRRGRLTFLLALAALAAVQVLFLLLGLGITARVPALRRSGWAVALAPIAGHLALIVLALGLNIRLARGGAAVLMAAGVLLALTGSVPRAVREAGARFARSRAMRR